MSRRNLTDVQVTHVRKLHDDGWSNQRIGMEFDILPQTVQDIVTGRTYAVPNAETKNRCVSPRAIEMRMVREFKLPPLPRPVLDYDPNYGRSYGLAPCRVSSRVERGEK